MFQRKYQVKGEDVNDVMIMQNHAYVKYSAKIFETFLLNSGYSLQKLQQLNIFWQKENEQLFKLENLFFTQFFYVNLNFNSINSSGNNLELVISFYNEKFIKHAHIVTTIGWYDLFSLKKINTPKRLVKYFIPKESYSSFSLAEE